MFFTSPFHATMFVVKAPITELPYTIYARAVKFVLMTIYIAEVKNI
jgi:hypothetical protein